MSRREQNLSSMKNISLLLGAGFSKPQGYPTAWELNSVITSIKADDLFMPGEGTVALLKYYGGTDVNAHLSIRERDVTAKMIGFFATLLNPFNYEDFIDIYLSLRNDPKQYGFDEFYRREILMEHTIGNDQDTMTQDLYRFHSSMMQIIARELTRRYDGKRTSSWAGYEGFLEYMAQEADRGDVFVHTLNHDVLFEQFNNTDIINERISDGFTDMDSPYFAEINHGAKATVRYFSNEYGTPIKLFKMHGSIDTIPFNFQDIDGTWSKTMIKTVYGANYYNYYRNFTNAKGETEAFREITNYHPDFLTGTKQKIKLYNGAHYFKQVFEHFQANIANSDRLLVIGYGGQDEVINHFIIDLFLSDPAKKLLYVNPTRPNTSILDYPNTKHFECGVSELTPELIEREFDSIGK